MPPDGQVFHDSTTNRSRRTAVSPEGWCYLLLLAFVFAWAILGEANLLLIVGGLLCGPIVCSWRAVSVALREVGVRRTVPRAVYAGEPLAVEIELRNGRSRVGSWALRVTDRVRREDDARRNAVQKPATLFPYVPAGESRRRAYHGRLWERGRYRFGPLEVSTRFPFGLLRRTVTLGRGDTDALTVFPRLGRLTRAWHARHREALQGTRGGRRPGRAPGDFCGVREWRSGDSVRRVHWRSTARHGEVVVCQFEQPRSRDLAVLVDLWQPARPDPDDLRNVELAVSFAATLVADVCRRGGGHLLLGITGAPPDLMTGPPSALLMEHAMERLAVAKASEEDHLPALLELAFARIRPGTEVLLVSPRTQDLTGTLRCTPSGGDPRRETASEIRLVRTADPAFSRYFEPEPTVWGRVRLRGA
jgi:uncharacterized protein (DUF58 family)